MRVRKLGSWRMSLRMSGVPSDHRCRVGLPTLAQSSIEDRYELDPATVEGSPTLQRWSDGTPDILSDIR
ncbi:MAG: hypothetical protein AAFR99_03380, partial [Cyanobacteria bacterium J06629_9]